MTQVDEFSTRTVAPGLRSAAWESTSAHLLHKVSVATPEGAPIDARIFSTRADGATIAEVWATGHVVSRSPSDIESFPTGAVAIAIGEVGSVPLWIRRATSSPPNRQATMAVRTRLSLRS